MAERLRPSASAAAAAVDADAALRLKEARAAARAAVASPPLLRLYFLPDFADPNAAGPLEKKWSHPRLILVTEYGIWVLYDWDTLILHRVSKDSGHTYSFAAALTSLCDPDYDVFQTMANKLFCESAECDTGWVHEGQEARGPHLLQLPLRALRGGCVPEKALCHGPRALAQALVQCV